MDINTSYNQSYFTGLNESQKSKNTQDKTKHNNTLKTNSNDDLSKLKIEFATQSYASEFGFRVDENGNFEKTLNKAANIPLSYEINLKSIQSISKELLKQDPYLKPSNIDIASLLNKYHSILQAVEPQFNQENNLSLSRAEISQLNQGFSTKDGSLEGQIIRVYDKLDKLKQAFEDIKIFAPLNFDNKITSFHFDSTINQSAENELIKGYINEKAQVSKTGLFMNFIHKNLQENQDFNTNAHEKFYIMLDRSTQSFQTYIQEQNKHNMSFDLYLYVHGIDKKNTSAQTISALYEQYLSQKTQSNMQDFTSSSEIYKLYSEALSDDFRRTRKDFISQSQDLELINEHKNQALNDFIDQRKKQVKLEELIKSYSFVIG